MDKREANRILRSLAEGIDPQNGVRIESLNVLERPEVIRALFLACETLSGKTQRAPRPGRERVGKPWTPEEDRQLLEFAAEAGRLANLATLLGRTTHALEVRLEKLAQPQPRRPSTVGEILRDLRPSGRRFKP